MNLSVYDQTWPGCGVEARCQLWTPFLLTWPPQGMRDILLVCHISTTHYHLELASQEHRRKGTLPQSTYRFPHQATGEWEWNHLLYRGHLTNPHDLKLDLILLQVNLTNSIPSQVNLFNPNLFLGVIKAFIEANGSFRSTIFDPDLLVTSERGNINLKKLYNSKKCRLFLE